jgi:hypothetical protein
MDVDAIRDRIQLYVSVYYHELRRQMDLYQAMPEAFPDFLKGSRRIVTVLGQDGVVVSHWAAERDTFEFYQSDKTMVEIANEQSGGGFGFDDFPPGSDVGMKVSRFEIYEGTDTSGPLKWRTPWEQIELSSNVSATRWNEELAASEASNAVLTFVTGHLLASDQSRPPEIFSKLESAISEFGTLLRRDPREEEVQRYLTENPGLLSQSAVSIKPKVELGSEYVTDFVIERVEQEYVLVEIERPGHSLFTRQGDPTKQLTHAQRQVEDWLDWVSDNKDYARRHILPGINEPEGWVIIGLRSRLDKKSKKALARRNRELTRIRVLTFDDLISDAKIYLSNLQRL